jgi:peptide/nickel transport system permease protein
MIPRNPAALNFTHLTPRRWAMSLFRIVSARIFWIFPVAFGVVTLTFFISRVVSSDPTSLFMPPGAPESFRATIRASLGLDKPLLSQYGTFLDRLVHGNLGSSITTGRSVTSDLWDRLPATFELAVYALLFAVVVGVPLGVVAALRRDKGADFFARGFSLLGMAVPSFWIGLILIWIFSVQSHILPGPIGRLDVGVAAPHRYTGFYTIDSLIQGNPALFWMSVRHLILPVFTLGLGAMAPIARVTRTAMVDALQADYIRTARAMGIGRFKIWSQYALRNCLVPVVTMVGSSVGYVFGGSVLVESVFGWPGVGKYALDAITHSDYAPLQGFVIYAAFLFVLAYLVVDLLYLVIDPRTRT